jgi:hypothetical protein
MTIDLNSAVSFLSIGLDLIPGVSFLSIGLKSFMFIV